MSGRKHGTGIRRYGPGKFDTILDSYVYAVSLDGADEEAGDVTTTNWYGLLRGNLQEAVEDVAAGEKDKLTPEEAAFLAENPAGAIIEETDQGFVAVEYFSSEKGIEKTWSELVSNVEAMEAEGGEGDEGEGDEGYSGLDGTLRRPQGDPKAKYDDLIRTYAIHGGAGRTIPDRGLCIGDSTGEYAACFLDKGPAQRAAQLLAEITRRTVDLVQVQNHGNDRFIVGQFDPGNLTVAGKGYSRYKAKTCVRTSSGKIACGVRVKGARR